MYHLSASSIEIRYVVVQAAVYADVCSKPCCCLPGADLQQLDLHLYSNFSASNVSERKPCSSIA